MSAQIIPFPVPRVRTQPQEKIDSDPAFWGFCDSQYRRADEMGQPRPLHSALKDWYRRGQR